MKTLNRIVAIPLLTFAMLLATIPITGYAYNSDYLSNASWISSKDTISKSIKNDNFDSSISYLIENNILYVQIYAKENSISTSSFCEIIAEKDGVNYNFNIKDYGLATNNQDVKHNFNVGADFFIGNETKVGKFVFAIEPKTKAPVKYSIFLWISNNKRYELISNINVSNSTTESSTTKAPTSIIEATPEIQQEKISPSAIITEEATTSKEATTKYSSQRKYKVSKKSNTTKSKTTKESFEPQSIPADFERQVYPHQKEVSPNLNSKGNKPLLFAGAGIGVFGFVAIGFALAKLTETKPTKKQEKSLEEADDFEF